MSRILAVDPGDRRIGIAISDPSRTIASPLLTFEHTSREADARRILKTAEEFAAARILIGVPYGADSDLTPQARKSIKLADALRAVSDLPIQLWDESGSTQKAAGIKSKHDRDSLAAAIILQDYLDEQSR